MLSAGRLLRHSAKMMEKGTGKMTHHSLWLHLARSAVLEETRQHKSAKRSHVVKVTEGDCAVDLGAQEATTDQSSPQESHQT